MALVYVQGNYLEPPSGLLAGASTQTVGFLHHLERWETGPETLPQPDVHQSEEGRGQEP